MPKSGFGPPQPVAVCRTRPSTLEYLAPPLEPLHTHTRARAKTRCGSSMRSAVQVVGPVAPSPRACSPSWASTATTRRSSSGRPTARPPAVPPAPRWVPTSPSSGPRRSPTSTSTYPPRARASPRRGRAARRPRASPQPLTPCAGASSWCWSASTRAGLSRTSRSRAWWRACASWRAPTRRAWLTWYLTPLTTACRATACA